MSSKQASYERARFIRPDQCRNLRYGSYTVRKSQDSECHIQIEKYLNGVVELTAVGGRLKEPKTIEVREEDAPLFAEILLDYFESRTLVTNA